MWLKATTPIGAHWRLIIARWRLGTALEPPHALGGESVPLQAPGGGFGEVVGWARLERPRAGSLGARHRVGSRREGGCPHGDSGRRRGGVDGCARCRAAPMKAVVVFTAYEEAPRSISALDEDGAVVAVRDLPPD